MRSVNVGIFKMPNLYLRILLCFHFYHEQRSCRGLAITFAKGHSRIFGFRNIWFLEYLVSGIFGFRNIWFQEYLERDFQKYLVGFISGIFGFDIPCFLEFARELRNLWLQQHRTIFGIKEQRLNVTEQTFQLILNSIKLIPICKF